MRRIQVFIPIYRQKKCGLRYVVKNGKGGKTGTKQPRTAGAGTGYNMEKEKKPQKFKSPPDYEDEVAIKGWDSIGRLFGRNGRLFRDKHRKELIECGAIFYMNCIWHEKPPSRRTVCAFPSVLKRWAGIKGSKGEMI